MSDLFVIHVDDREGYSENDVNEYVEGDKKLVERYARAKYGGEAEICKMKVVKIAEELVVALETKKQKRDEERRRRENELKHLEERKKQLKAEIDKIDSAANDGDDDNNNDNDNDDDVDDNDD
jgi:hypothetical protein